MLRQPKFKCQQKVQFNVDADEPITGEIVVVGTNGIYSDSTEIYYDILGESNGKEVTFRQIPEIDIKKVSEEE